MHEKFFHYRVTSQVTFKSLSAVPSKSFQKAYSFQIAVFLQSLQFGTRNITTELSRFFAKQRYFKWQNLRKNPRILDSRKLGLFCLAKIVEGTQVILGLKVIGFKESFRNKYSKTPLSSRWTLPLSN